MVPLARAVVSGRYERAAAATSAQSAKTETALDLIGHRLDQKPAPILFVGPSADFNRDQFEPRLTAMLEECPRLNAKFLRGKKEKKSLKIVAGVRVRLASGASSTALKSDPAALALIDEYDEMARNIRGQGEALGLVEARGDTFADSITVVTSTTSKGIVETEKLSVGFDEHGNECFVEFWAIGDVTEIESPIWRLFQEGTRHHWAWPCPHCDAYFIPMRKHLHWDTGATPAQARKSAHLICPCCGCEIHEGEKGEVKAAMNAKGVMIAPGQTIEDAKLERNIPENATYSQWNSGLCSPFVTWGKRAERMVKAEMSGEEDKVQTAVNTNFGELYTPGLTGDLPDWEGLLKHRTDFAPLQLHRGILHIVMGVDVQKRGLYFIIRGYGARGTSWLIQHGYLIGETAEDDVWEQLAMIMLSPIDGVHIEKVLIDAGFRPDKPDAGSVHRVYDFCRQYAFLAFPCKGRSTMGGRPYAISQIEVKGDGQKRPFSTGLVMTDTDYFKSLVHTRIKTPLGHPGAFYLHNEADEAYARQVLSEVRIVHPGKTRPEWKPVRRDNHYFDAEVLCAVGAYTLNVQMIPEGVVRAWADDDETLPDANAPAPAVIEAAVIAETQTAPMPAGTIADANAAKASLRKKFGRFGVRR
jgi:phage terminase large subunit GpA-like protein